MPILDINNKNEVKKYKEFINKNKYARLTQALEWADVKNNWKKEIVYLEENGEVIASMLILIQSMKFGGYNIMYAPRGPVCNIYDIDIVKRLIEEVKTLVNKYKVCMIKFDPQVEFTEELNKLYLENGFNTSGKNPDHDELIQPIHEAVLNLDGKDYDMLMKSFAEKTRYNIRLSSRKGVEIRFSTPYLLIGIKKG
jgi:lipid II:glycine glycyltransferase (peptidoglycan interpeptide bridge formation enzyme)